MTSRLKLIQSLYRKSITPKIKNIWHARISNAIKSGKLTEKNGLDPAVFKAWAYNNFGSKLAADQEFDPILQAYVKLDGIECCGQVGQVPVTTNIPQKSGASPETLKLINQLEACQLELHKERYAHAAVKRQLDEIKMKRAKSSNYGKKGGRPKKSEK